MDNHVRYTVCGDVITGWGDAIAKALALPSGDPHDPEGQQAVLGTLARSRWMFADPDRRCPACNQGYDRHEIGRPSAGCWVPAEQIGRLREHLAAARAGARIPRTWTAGDAEPPEEVQALLLVLPGDPRPSLHFRHLDGWAIEERSLNPRPWRQICPASDTFTGWYVEIIGWPA